MNAPALPFQGLDFIYMPSSDVAADVEYFTSVLGAKLTFAIESFGTRVAMVRLGQRPPDLLFAGHLEGERPILVYRVADLGGAREALEARGWEPAPVFGIPHGPCCAFQTPDGHRVAIYELTRPQAAAHLGGRRDF
jgi:hypothetical protein